MTRTKTRPSNSSKNLSVKNKEVNGAQQVEVLTLSEAAAFFRVNAEELLRMVATHALPGRQFGTEWRFLKSALRHWLAVPAEKKRGLLSQVGAIKDDPYLPEMLEEIYRRRGRPMIEED